MSPLDAFDRIVTGPGGSAECAGPVAEMRRTFEKRTGSFGPEDPWFESRSRAFWDDALTRQAFAKRVSAQLTDEVRHWVGPLSRAHRGLFEVEKAERDRDAANARWILHDLWGGASFEVELADVGMADALDAATSPLDARLVACISNAAARPEVAILPGAVFHPEDAHEPILKVLAIARARHLDGHDVLDALLRMEKNLRSLSRVKASYAYREAALLPPSGY